MKKFSLSFLFLSMAAVGFCTTHTVVNSSFTFSPATLTITEGDSVDFNLGSIHNAREVSQATWDANGNTALSGGFETAFGGELVLPAELEVGMHYYVCVPHAGMGMKATINVLPGIGVAETAAKANVNFYPNPSNGTFQLFANDLNLAENCTLEIMDMQGNRVYQSRITNSISNIDLSGSARGIYLMKISNSNGIINRRIVIQ